jgi:hypothetical protein
LGRVPNEQKNQTTTHGFPKGSLVDSRILADSPRARSKEAATMSAKTTTCDWCKRTLSKSKMRKPMGQLWKCHPKGGYKNAIECLHLNDEEVFIPSEIQWLKPDDISSFAEKEIEKADRWLAKGDLCTKEHGLIIRYIKEASQ